MRARFVFGFLALMLVPVRSAHAAESDAERQIQEHFRLGEADWKKSCAKPFEDGACVRVKPAAAGRARCGPTDATVSEITVVDRDKKRAASAKQHFESAVKLWKEGAQKNYGAATATAAAGAFFYLAEGPYENLLRKTAPTDLDFTQPAESDSASRFTGYLTDKSKALSAARDGYLEAFKLGRVPWNVAAAARIGQSYQDFAQQLQTMAIPKAVAGKEEARGVYCKILDEKARPIAGKAIEAFEMCIKTANENDGRGSWSELCERELGRLKPARPAPAADPKPTAPAPAK
jgi:hypothetical protein